MARYRNVTAVPLDGLPDGLQLFAQEDIELSKADLSTPGVIFHISQGTLVPVTMSTTAAPAGKSA